MKRSKSSFHEFQRKTYAKCNLNIKIWINVNLFLFKQVDNYVVGPRLKPQHKQPNRHKDIGTHGEKEETVTNSPSSRGLCNTKEEMVRETHCMTKTGIDYCCYIIISWVLIVFLQEEENAEASSDATFSSDSENDHG